MFFIELIIVTGIEIWLGFVFFILAPIPYVVYTLPVINVIAIICFYRKAKKYERTPARGIACPRCGNQEGNTSQIVSAGSITTQITTHTFGSSNINVKYLTCPKCFTSWTLISRQQLDKMRDRSYIWCLAFLIYTFIWWYFKIKYDVAVSSIG